MKTAVAVIFGGKSVEHEVSVLTGLQVLAALDTAKYDPVPLYLAKDGLFYTGKGLDSVDFYRELPASLTRAVRVLPVPGKNGVDLLHLREKRFGGVQTVGRFDVALPAVHGTNAEDGTLAGYLEMLGVPYAGCDVLSSALGMDKWKMKTVLKAAGLPVLDAVAFTAGEYAADPDKATQKVTSVCGLPCVVKPVNLGSSVGITKASDRRALYDAFDLAFAFSPRVLAEPAVSPLREINCAVLGDDEEALSSVCEEPLGSDEILSYGDKYLSGGAGGKTEPAKAGMSGQKRRCPADIPPEREKAVRDLAVRTFRALGCSGVARVDFLMNAKTGELWVNEINTIPGSLAFYLWEASGIPFAELLDRLIALAFKHDRQKKALTFTYDTNILSDVPAGGAKK